MLFKTYCVIDQKEIPEDRQKKRAVTCSKECKTKLKDIRRKEREGVICPICRRPSTPEERKLFTQWMRETGRIKKTGRPPKAVAPPVEEVAE